MRFAVFDSPFLIWIASHRYDCHWPAGLLGLSCLDFSIPPRWVAASGYRRGCNLRLAAAFSSMRMRFAVFDSPLLIGLATHRYDCDWSAGLLGLSCLDFSIPPAWVAASDYRRDCNLRLAAVFSSMRVRFAVFDSTFLIGLASHRYDCDRLTAVTWDGLPSFFNPSGVGCCFRLPSRLQPQTRCCVLFYANAVCRFRFAAPHWVSDSPSRGETSFFGSSWLGRIPEIWFTDTL